jgi:hypothetical protein
MHRVVVAAALALGAAALVAPSRAYAFGGEKVDAHVPFAFRVDGVRLPAGEYVIRRVDYLEPNLLRITSRYGVEEAFFMTDNASPVRPVRVPKLVFDQYGTQRFLHAIWLPDDTGAVVRVSPTEVLTARNMALERAGRPMARKGR